MRLAGLREYRFTALIDPHQAFAGAQERRDDDAYAIAIGEGDAAGSAHLETLRAGSPKRFKNVRRLDHKMEREIGPVELIGPDYEPTAFELILNLKCAQGLGLTVPPEVFQQATEILR